MQATVSENAQEQAIKQSRTPHNKKKRGVTHIFPQRKPKIRSISLNKSCSANILIEDNYEQSYLSTTDYSPVNHKQVDSETQSKHSTSTFHTSTRSSDFSKYARAGPKIEDILKEFMRVKEELMELDKQITVLETDRTKVMLCVIRLVN